MTDRDNNKKGTSHTGKDCCDPGSGCCSPSSSHSSRRDFVKTAVLGVSAFGLPRLPVFAGPFEFKPGGHLIPEDKRLSADWIKSLYERGEPEILEGEELRYVGMPVGGIACGQLYIGGDGRLWLWDIFRVKYRRREDSQLLIRMEQGGHYAHPEEAFTREERSVEHGVAVKVNFQGNEIVKQLNSKGFKDIQFRGEYPISRINYQSEHLPITVKLEAFSPFIPGELEKSANPCTILSYSIKNLSDKTVEVSMASWLENAVNPYDSDKALGQRTSQLIASENRKTILFASKSGNGKGAARLEDQHGFGSMSWTLYNPSDHSRHVLDIDSASAAEDIFDAIDNSDRATSKSSPLDQKYISTLSETITLKPGEEQNITFVLAWYFPHLNQQKQDAKQNDLHMMTGVQNLKLHYANRFESANEVADYICADFDELAAGTRHWNNVWYDSTLPYWMLDRVFIALNCLATNTLLWFNNNRMWGWEGVECCPGTCTHVWQYAQALAHIFPEAERNFREITDLSEVGLNEDGSLRNRAENETHAAHDGHSGTIMRMYREHKKSADRSFLEKNYAKIKKMVRFIIIQDQDQNGILEGKQQNTLDAAWYGPMGWVSSLYLGALAAGKQMAIEMNDQAFADECNNLLEKGRKNILELFNGEYFIHKPDSDYPEAINSNDGCHIDQVLGQSMTHMVGISERVVPQKETISALESIWKYNFAPDAFEYQLDHKAIKGPRIYATQGEAATIMCTWPKGGDDKAVPGMEKREDFPDHWSGPGIYFDEAMNGFEYQVAAHMIYEDLLEKGLATAKAVHDRYTATKRNPFNEIECSDHYSRSMASYAVFLAVCGYDYHGPKGQLTFDPKLSPEDFKAPFTTAEGWGSFEQQRKDAKQFNKVKIVYGQLKLSQLNLRAYGIPNNPALASLNGERVETETVNQNGKIIIGFEELILSQGDLLELIIS